MQDGKSDSFCLSTFCTCKKFIKSRQKNKSHINIGVSPTTNLSYEEYNLSDSPSEEYSVKCVRCGYIMEGSKAILITIHIPSPGPQSYVNKNAINGFGETSCPKCGLPNSFHSSIKQVLKCTYKAPAECSETELSDHSESSQINLPKSDENTSDDDLVTIVDEDNSQRLHCGNTTEREGVTIPCSDCHIALKCDCDEFCDMHGKRHLSLLLQVADPSFLTQSTESQTEQSSSEPDIGRREDLLRIDPQRTRVSTVALPSQENLPGAEEYTLPECNPENLAAYQSHLKNLVPCSFCGRKFNPDRVMVHEGACIKRPKKRTYQTPEKEKV